MSTISGDTNTVGEAGVTGIFGGDPRVVDQRDFAAGVLGLAFGQPGVWGIASGGPGVFGQVQGDQSVGVLGRSDTDPDTQLRGIGIQGVGAIGVVGDGSVGVKGNGFGDNSVGVSGEGAGNDSGVGVQGHSFGFGIGVVGISQFGDGVRGRNGAGSGLLPLPKVGTGVSGESDNGIGVYASSGTNVGMMGESRTTNGVLGVTHSQSVAAVSGVNKSGGIGIYGEGRIAGSFAGDVEVTGDIRLTGSGQDCAEDFDIMGTQMIEPGTVMVIEEGGALRQSDHEYDKKVAGVVSGAGDYKPAIVLGRQGAQHNRLPIALLGKVYCKVDAQFSAIEVGDLLTTSPTPGHAMKAADPAKALGTLIGKALRPLREGQGMIPILVALQ